MTVEKTYHRTDVNGNELSDEEREWMRDNDIRFDEPFTNTNWKTVESRDRWRDLLATAATAKHEAEWRSVMDDRTDRKAAIIHVNNYNREKWLKRVGKHGLAYRDIRYSEPYDGFSHRHIPTTEDNPNRLTYAVIAENEQYADEMEAVETGEGGADRHDRVGELLNFPDCCREYFNDEWLGGCIDPIYETTCNTGSARAIDGDPQNVLVEEPVPWTNIMYRYFGWSFVTHIPCSWDCEESIEIAKARGEIMADAGYEDAANAMYNFLDLPMVWSCKNGIAHVKNRHFIGTSSSATNWNEKRVVWGEENEAGGSIV